MSVGEAPPPLKLATSEELLGFQVGDFVKISSDREQVCELQQGHGEWVESMIQVSLCLEGHREWVESLVFALEGHGELLDSMHGAGELMLLLQRSAS